MKTLSRTLVAVSVLLGGVATSHGDDLTGADVLLCTPVRVNECTASQGCESAMPWDYNLPLFVRLDLARGVLSTTEASSADRSTAIGTMQRENGMIVLQGIDNARAFSFVVIEETGLMSAAVARDGITVSIFGACTPER